MLWVVLALVAAAFGLLVTALTSGAMLFAWLSVAASAAAAVVLVVDWARRRSRRLTAPDDAGPISGPLVPEAAESTSVAEPTPESTPGSTSAEPSAEPETSTSVRAAGDVPDVPAEQEPPEEDTDAADVLLVSESRLQVVVLDERPRYHLSTCGWLGGRTVLPLAVREARELGFTPCAVCAPDRVLAAQTRRTAKA
jgi:hypothetical protein